jgi:hypothetical protein
MTSSNANYLTQRYEDGRPNEWRGPDLRHEGSGWFSRPIPLLLTMLALGAFTWYYLGKDIQRYIRIRNM